MKNFTLTFPGQHRRNTTIPARRLVICMCFLLTVHNLIAQAPDLAWRRFANGAANDFDMAGDVTTDRDGNVYVTGRSRTKARGTDCLTIKYSREGAEVWRETYDVSAADGIYDDSGTDIAVDANGDIYVIGTGLREIRNHYGFILKYDPSGTLLWSREYHGGRFSFININRSTGDVIVAGNHIGFDCSHFCDSFLTVCYDSSGNLRWDRVLGRSAFDYATGTSIDNLGNIFISGASGIFPSEEFTTIKYSPDGVQLYLTAHLPSPWGTGMAIGMAGDNSGNVYVVGAGTDDLTEDRNDLMLVKYDPAGDISFIVSETDMYPGKIAVQENHVYVLLRSEDGTELAKYDPESGMRTWMNHIDDPGTSNMQLEVDDAGNVYVAGTNDASTEDATYWIIKYDSYGVEKWRLNEPTTGLTINELHIDEHSKIYIAGFKKIGDFISPNVDYLTAKYEHASVPVIPESLRDYRRIEAWAYAPSRDWCWTDIAIDWELFCISLPLCPDPTVGASLTENKKVIWQEEFSKPFNYVFSIDDKLPNVLSFSRPGSNAFLVLDENLVQNKFSSVHLEAFPQENVMKLSVETDEGKHMPFAVSLLDKQGKEIWSQTFVAPLTTEIQATVKTPGTTLKLSALPTEIDLKYYPNPSVGKITVEVDAASKQSPAAVSIYSMMGEQLTYKLIDSNAPYTVDLGKQKPGLYILLVKIMGKETSELIEVKY